MACPVLDLPGLRRGRQGRRRGRGHRRRPARSTGSPPRSSPGSPGWSTQTSTWWVQLPSPDLAGEPAVGQLQQWMLPLTVAVAVLGLIIAGGKMALTRRANPLIDVGSGLAVIAATSAVGVLLPYAAAQGGRCLVHLGAPGARPGASSPSGWSTC